MIRFDLLRHGFDVLEELGRVGLAGQGRTIDGPVEFTQQLLAGLEKSRRRAIQIGDSGIELAKARRRRLARLAGRFQIDQVLEGDLPRGFALAETRISSRHEAKQRSGNGHLPAEGEMLLPPRYL